MALAASKLFLPPSGTTSHDSRPWEQNLDSYETAPGAPSILPIPILSASRQVESEVKGPILHVQHGVAGEIHVPIHESKLIALGVAIGYPDWDNPANATRTKREPLDKVVAWYGFGKDPIQ